MSSRCIDCGAIGGRSFSQSNNNLLRCWICYAIIGRQLLVVSMFRMSALIPSPLTSSRRQSLIQSSFAAGGALASSRRVKLSRLGIRLCRHLFSSFCVKLFVNESAPQVIRSSDFYNQRDGRSFTDGLTLRPF